MYAKIINLNPIPMPKCKPIKKDFETNDMIISLIDGEKGQVLDIGKYTDKVIVKWDYSKKITLEPRNSLEKYRPITRGF